MKPRQKILSKTTVALICSLGIIAAPAYEFGSHPGPECVFGKLGDTNQIQDGGR